MSREYEGAVKELRDAEQKLNEIISNRSKYEAAIPDYEADVRDTEKKKDAAYDLYVLKQITEKDLDKAKENYEYAKKKVSNAIDILEAAERQTKKLRTEIPALQSKVQVADRGRWRGIENDLISKINNRGVPDLLRQLYACKIRSGGTAYDYRNLIFIVCGGAPSPDTIKQLQDELANEYGIALEE